MYIIQYASSSSNKRKILPRYQRISCAMHNSDLFLPILQWHFWYHWWRNCDDVVSVDDGGKIHILIHNLVLVLQLWSRINKICLDFKSIGLYFHWTNGKIRTFFTLFVSWLSNLICFFTSFDVEYLLYYLLSNI